MRNLLFLIAAALGALLPSCTPANRVVENPLIATANTQTLDIVKVELSDTGPKTGSSFLRTAICKSPPGDSCSPGPKA